MSTARRANKTSVIEADEANSEDLKCKNEAVQQQLEEMSARMEEMNETMQKMLSNWFVPL